MAYKLTAAKNSRKASLKKDTLNHYAEREVRVLDMVEGPFFDSARARDKYEIFMQEKGRADHLVYLKANSRMRSASAPTNRWNPENELKDA